jgi:hypothetical protein
MANTPILINLRATEWDQIATLLEYAAGCAEHSDSPIVTTTADKFAKAIRTRIEESE